MLKTDQVYIFGILLLEKTVFCDFFLVIIFLIKHIYFHITLLISSVIQPESVQYQFFKMAKL